MGRGRRSSLLTCTCLASALVSQAEALEDETLVEVRDILIEPASQFTYDDHHLQMHLEGLATLGYDSNVLATASGSHAQGDGFLSNT